MCLVYNQLGAFSLQAHGLLADASIGANIKYVIQKLLILEDDTVCLKRLFLRDGKGFKILFSCLLMLYLCYTVQVLSCSPQQQLQCKTNLLFR